jgi:DNA transformation protein and related proteins
VGAVDDSFIATVLTRLRGVEGLGCRAMFGGHALYRGPTLFGIVSGGRIYLKTDDSTLPEYVRRGMQPFHSGGDGGALGTYYQLPADVVGDPEHLREWAQAAGGCAAGATPLFTASATGPAQR